MAVPARRADYRFVAKVPLQGKGRELAWQTAVTAYLRKLKIVGEPRHAVPLAIPPRLRTISIGVRTVKIIDAKRLSAARNPTDGLLLHIAVFVGDADVATQALAVKIYVWNAALYRSVGEGRVQFDAAARTRIAALEATVIPSYRD